jgi:hypothetical protein
MANVIGTPSTGVVDNAGSSPSFSVPVPSGLASGELWLIVGWADIDTATNITAGDSRPQVGAPLVTLSGWPIVFAFRKVAGSSESAVTLTVNAGNTWKCMYWSARVEDFDSTTPIDAYNTGTNSDGTGNIATPSVTSSAANALALACAVEAGNSGTVNQPGGVTLEYELQGDFAVGTVFSQAVGAVTWAPGNSFFNNGQPRAALSFIVKDDPGASWVPQTNAPETARVVIGARF